MSEPFKSESVVQSNDNDLQIILGNKDRGLSSYVAMCQGDKNLRGYYHYQNLQCLGDKTFAEELNKEGAILSC